MNGPKPDAVLDLHHVSKAFGSTHALRDVSLAIEPEKTTALLGPSGCGKSTLLRLMIGLLRPDGGTVHFEGEAITPQNVERLRRRMGYVIQDGGLFPHLTARQNVTLMAHYLDQVGDRIESRLRELADLTTLPLDALGRYPVQLSGGQRQRVGLMRALFLDPDVLLLDEPLGALDPLIRADLQDDLRTIFRDLGKTVVLVTHDVGEAAYLGDTLVLLRDGEIVHEGSLEDFAERPAEPFVERFLRAQRNPAFDRA